ncbi:MAG: NAD(P)H-hydrate dehydratase [Betaproteobacteria bacterium HGW-Betaproteobacteria-22]|nr:MAG: NAD(P)H-hydrate dehydratase [Betaproteobacteria bacterium HGW-Betaproteobacteria-22]
MLTGQDLLSVEMLQPILPSRQSDAHKGDAGSVALIGGDDGMLGAIILASRAASLIGAGRVYAAMLGKSAPAVDILHPELMMRSPSALVALPQLDCVAIGPGLGRSSLALEVLAFWLQRQVALLLDADALNIIAANVDLENQLRKCPGEVVITPHVGEAARLLGLSAESVQKNRVEMALALAKRLQVTCVLKGAGTVIAQRDGQYVINPTGNPALAAAGTGDVLSGAIAGLVAQGLVAVDAVKLGVYVHGAAADALVARGIGPLGVSASEIALEMRSVINRLNQNL